MNVKMGVAKDIAQDAMMRGLQVTISNMSGREQAEAIRQFRRIEKLFGYIPNSWSPFV